MFHRYRDFDRPGTHVAFRGTYMQRMHIFFEESDVEIAAQMSRTTLQDTGGRVLNVSSRPSTSLPRLPRRLLLPSHWWPRELFVLIAPIEGLFRL